MDLANLGGSGLKFPRLSRGLGTEKSKISRKSLVRNRNSPDLFTVTFYERRLWAGLLGWPD